MQVEEFAKDMYLVQELKPILDICEQLAVILMIPPCRAESKPTWRL